MGLKKTVSKLSYWVGSFRTIFLYEEKLSWLKVAQIKAVLFFRIHHLCSERMSGGLFVFWSVRNGEPSHWTKFPHFYSQQWACIYYNCLLRPTQDFQRNEHCIKQPILREEKHWQAIRPGSRPSSPQMPEGTGRPPGPLLPPGILLLVSFFLEASPPPASFKEGLKLLAR